MIIQYCNCSTSFGVFIGLEIQCSLIINILTNIYIDKFIVLLLMQRNSADNLSLMLMYQWLYTVDLSLWLRVVMICGRYRITSALLSTRCSCRNVSLNYSCATIEFAIICNRCVNKTFASCSNVWDMQANETQLQWLHLSQRFKCRQKRTATFVNICQNFSTLLSTYAKSLLNIHSIALYTTCSH